MATIIVFLLNVPRQVLFEEEILLAIVRILLLAMGLSMILLLKS